MGHCMTIATHSQPVMGVAPTNRRIQATFWDLHRFNAEGQIVETWNLTDSPAIMQNRACPVRPLRPPLRGPSGR